MSNPVASMVSDYIVQALEGCSSHLDAAAAEEFMKKTGPRPSVAANQLVLSINVPCAVSKLTSKGFHDEVAQAVYNMIKSVPFLHLSHKFSGSETEVVAAMSKYLGEILSKETVEGCVLGFNTSQVTLTAQGSWSALTQPTECQLKRIALCMACHKKLATMYEADLSKVGHSVKSKGPGDTSYWWILWVILLIVVVIGLWMWIDHENKKKKALA